MEGWESQGRILTSPLLATPEVVLIPPLNGRMVIVDL